MEMYETGKETSIRGIIVRILLIILVICILIWIFPTKKDIKNINVTNNTVLLDEIFGRNLRILQNAGHAYYYSATIPKNIGDQVSTSLNELIEKKMLLELKDKDGKTCDGNASYVELTKKADNEYELKSYLKCGNESNYLLDTLKCSEFKSNCTQTIIITNKDKDNEKEIDDKEIIEEKTEEKEESKETKEPKTISYYRYLYSCPKTTKSYSDWSSWSKTYVSSNSNREVQTKVEYERTYVKTGTKQEEVTTMVKETVDEVEEKELTYVNYKPSNAKSCYTVPRSTYTLYICKIETTKKVTKEVPKTTYKTVDVYDWKTTPVTYYRYRTLSSTTSSYTVWSTNGNNKNYSNIGCTIIKSEKVTK